MTKSLSISGDVKLLDGTTEVLSDALSISENYTEVTVQEVSLAASAADQSIAFGGVANATLLILVPTYVDGGDAYLTVNVNGGSEDIRLGKMAVLGGNASNGITALTVSNPDTANSVQLKVYLCE